MKRMLHYCLLLAIVTLLSCRGFFPHRIRYPTVSCHSTNCKSRDKPLCASQSDVSDANITLSASSSATSTTTSALTLQQQAQALRAEACALERSLNETKQAKIQKELDAVDRWIDELLINITINEDTQMLNTVEQVTQILQDRRYTQDHVNKIFERIGQLNGPQSRSKCSPLVTLLVDASGKLDCVEREDNPNKRWNGRVERELRKRLFAMDWGIELEKNDNENQPPGGLL